MKYGFLLIVALCMVLYSFIAEAGTREPIISLSNCTTTVTTTVDLDHAERWDARIVLNNFTGTLALDLSWDNRGTWVNRTTVSTETSAFNIVSHPYELATDMRLVVTDSFYNITGTEAAFPHVTPGLEVDIIQYYERD